MNNFSRLEQEHPDFIKLPKLPYVIGADKTKIFTLDKQTSDTQDSFLKDKIGSKEIVNLYNHVLDRKVDNKDTNEGVAADQLAAYRSLVNRLFYYPDDYEKNIDFVNSLTADEYEQLVETMAKYWELEVKLKPRK